MVDLGATSGTNDGTVIKLDPITVVKAVGIYTADTEYAAGTLLICGS